MASRAKVILVWIHYALLLAGIAALGYDGIVVVEATRYQAWAREQLRNSNQGLVTAPASVVPALPWVRAPRSKGSGRDLLGTIDIPRVHLSAMLAEGVTSQVLQVAVGHIGGTALPGQSGGKCGARCSARHIVPSFR